MRGPRAFRLRVRPGQRRALRADEDREKLALQQPVTTLGVSVVQLIVADRAAGSASSARSLLAWLRTPSWMCRPQAPQQGDGTSSGLHLSGTDHLTEGHAGLKVEIVGRVDVEGVERNRVARMMVISIMAKC